jgi:Flp pilus assembly protein TadD
VAQEETDQVETAANSYAEALSLDPTDDEVRMHLAMDQLAVDRVVEASENFHEIRKRRPKNELVVKGLAICYRRKGKTNAARELLDSVLPDNPREAGILAERGRVELDSGNAADAEKWIRRSLEVKPNDSETNYNLYTCLRCLGEREEAQRQLKAVQRIDAAEKRWKELRLKIPKEPYNLDLCCEAGIVLVQTGRSEEGLRMLRNVLKVDPRHPNARQALASCLETDGGSP